MTTRIAAIGIVLFFFPLSRCFGYDDKVTHRDLTQKAAAKENSVLDDILKRQLLLPEGVLQSLPSENGVENPPTVTNWLRYGAMQEDAESICRASNHFHNPLNSKAWTNSGIAQEAILLGPEMRDFCFAFSLYPIGEAKSNITWATDFILPPPNGVQINTQNAYNWKLARSYYGGALTAASAEDRQRNYAETFRALGQVLHMLQDTAVPSHVRSDFRSHWNMIEFRLGWNPLKWPYEPYERYVAEQSRKLMSEYGASERIIRPSFSGETSLTKFWDTNLYSEICGDQGQRRSGTDLGLAEYTNANHVSYSTVFTENLPCNDNYAFPHPSLAETDYLDQTVGTTIVRFPNGSYKEMRYLTIVDQEGLASWETSTRKIARMSYWDWHRENYQAVIDSDPALNEAMASRLIPRAIGYSAALLDYFFRGKFDDPGDGRPFIEVLKNGHVRVNIKNGSGERMSGTLMLYQDSGEEEVHGENPLLPVLKTALVTLESGDLYDGPEFMDVPVTVPPGKSINDLIFTLYFGGTIGLEENAVAGRRAKAYPTKLDLAVVFQPYFPYYNYTAGYLRRYRESLSDLLASLNGSSVQAESIRHRRRRAQELRRAHRRPIPLREL